MQEKPDENKATTDVALHPAVEKIRAIAAAGGNSMAQLIIALEALGATGRDAIAEITGKSIRMVQKTAKQIRALECANPSAPRTPVREPECAAANPGSRNEPRCANPSARREPECASPARGVVPNPTTVEVISTQDRSPSPLPPYSPPIPSSPSRKCDPDGVTWDANSKTILLDDGNRAFWLDMFEGDAARLDLALIEAAGSIQPNSRQPLALQVGRSLSRIVADRKDRDRRYAKAAAAKQASPAQPRMDLNTRKAAEVAELRRRMKAREEAANAAHH